MAAAPVLFSIVVPTFERRDIVLATVSSVAATRRPWPCELIVVVDGSRDGTAEALRGLDLPLPLTVHEQPNRGSAAARNAGAAVARGEYLLFLDDDMTVEEGLLVEHERTLAAGADAVVGHMELDPASPPTLLTRGIERWAAQRRTRLERSGGQLGVGDFLSGQLSVRAEWFARLGGFDAGLTDGGSFGGEDTDLVHRLLRDGARVRANLAAVSHQHYAVTPRQNIRQWRQAGRADTVLARKHPGLGPVLTANHGGDTVTGRLVRALAALPDPVVRAAGERVVGRAGRGHRDATTEFLFARYRDTVYWRSVREHGGLGGPADTGLRIVAYHAIADLTDRHHRPWGVPPERFAEQIAALLEAGHHVIDADDLLDHLDGRPLPPRSVLLTFDDAYESVLTEALPVLDRYGLRGVVGVVGDQIGGYDAWAAGRGAERLPLLDAAGLATLRDRGWEIASHSRRHAHLTTLSAAGLRDDLRAGRDALVAAGLGTPRIFVHPYGEQDSRVRAHVRRAGFAAALAVTTGRARPGPGDRYALPRVEVTRDTTPAALLRMLDSPPRTGPAARAGREAHALATALGVPAALARLRRPRAGTGSPAVWCGEAELAGDAVPTGVVAARDETTMRLLVRLHGEPLGYLTLPRTGTPADAAAVRAAAWREFGPALEAHLTAEGAPVPAESERPDWRAGAAPAACPNRTGTEDLFSVVVCTRNRSESLPACLDRLAALDHPALEFLIVDNAPADASTELLVKSYTAADDRFRYLCEPRPGLSRARNAGLAAARGRHVAYTDDDVAVDAGWIRGLARGFQRRPDVVCVTGLVGTASIANDSEAYCDARLLSWSTRTRPQLFDMSPARRGDVLYPFSAGVFGTGASFAFDRERLIRLGGFDEALGAGTRTRGGEDLDAFVRVLLAGGAIAYEPSALVWHHHRADEDSLREQMFGYGTGLTAYLTKLLLDRGTRTQVLRRVPAGVARIARIKRQTGERLAASVTAPRGALRREFAGYLAGPWLYAAARRAVRRTGARP